MREVTFCWPISELVSSLSKNQKDIKTQRAIDRISGICSSCLDSFRLNDLEKIRYEKPYSHEISTGYFCKECMNDSKIKTIFQ